MHIHKSTKNILYWSKILETLIYITCSIFCTDNSCERKRIGICTIYYCLLSVLVTYFIRRSFLFILQKSNYCKVANNTVKTVTLSDNILSDGLYF